MSARRRGEEGYALIAAVVSIVIFALMSLMMINAVRGPIIMASAENDRARLSAAADAGVALAIKGLMARDPLQRWQIAGKLRRTMFDGNRLDIVIEDERGKIALNLINKQQVDKMFGAFGLSGAARETAVDSYMDWRDPDDDARPRGAERGDYAAQKIRPRDGELRSVGELALIKGVGKELAVKMAPFVTVNFGAGEFDPRYSTPIAVQVSKDDEEGDFADFASGISVGGKAVRAQRSAVSDSLIGRPLTIRVDASHGADAHARREVIIELTGAPLRPYVIRARE